MKRIIQWLETKSSDPGKTSDPVQRSSTVNHKSNEIGNDDYGIDVSYSHAPTVPDLEILNVSSQNVDISSGFDPYDTVVLHQKPGSKKS